jgi:hypothetical protein
MKLLPAALIAMAAMAAEPVRTPVLAELFTSEGCSSCPPADALLIRLDRAQPVPGAQIIVLSEHVDYWNSQGWRDPFSSPLFTHRQDNYTRVLGAENYTPQMVIDGRAPVIGSNPRAVEEAITRAATHPKSRIRIEARRDGRDAYVTLAIDPVSHADVWIAIAGESARSSVTRGENANRTIDHIAVVRTLTKAGTVKKGQTFEKTARVPAPVAEPSRVIVFLADFPGPVTGAAQISLP